MQPTTLLPLLPALIAFASFSLSTSLATSGHIRPTKPPIAELSRMPPPASIDQIVRGDPDVVVVGIRVDTIRSYTEHYDPLWLRLLDRITGSPQGFGSAHFQDVRIQTLRILRSRDGLVDEQGDLTHWIHDGSRHPEPGTPYLFVARRDSKGGRTVGNAFGPKAMFRAGETPVRYADCSLVPYAVDLTYEQFEAALRNALAVATTQQSEP